MNNSILFAEWLAEKHYRLYNIEKGVYYWRDELVILSSETLYEIFKQETKNN